MLRRKEGATIAQIVAATGWQPHTVRGAFAGALKKKLGLTVTSEKVEGGERVYRHRLKASTGNQAISTHGRARARPLSSFGRPWFSVRRDATRPTVLPFPCRPDRPAGRGRRLELAAWPGSNARAMLLGRVEP